jgi:RNA polymerase sigma-70 factor, ECF subfamily
MHVSGAEPVSCARSPVPPRGPIRPDRDADLVAALRRHEPGAAETLLARYGTLLYRVAVRITRSVPDAEDVVQDSVWPAVSRIESFRGEAAFGSWLYRIATNAAYEVCRRRRTELGHPPAPVPDRSAADAHPVQAELRDVLAAAIGGLPADHGEVFRLHAVEGLSNSEMAQALGLSVPAVKSRLHRSRRYLRARLAPYVSDAA